MLLWMLKPIQRVTKTIINEKVDLGTSSMSRCHGCYRLAIHTHIDKKSV